MSDKPKRTITPEQRAKMAAGRKAAHEKRKLLREADKARLKQELLDEKKRMKEAEKQQKDRLKNAQTDNAAKKRIKKELEQLKESMKIETKKPVEKKELVEIIEEIEEVAEEVAEEVKEVLEEKKEEVLEKKEDDKPKLTKTQLEGLFRAKVSEIVDNLPDENTKNIFQDTANNYDWNDSVDNKIKKLMKRAQSRYTQNRETIEEKKKEIEEKIKNDEYEKGQLEKKNRMERMRARYDRLTKRH